MAAQAKNKTILEEFMVGCKKGFYVGVENIMPAMVLAYSLILFLNITGLMDIIANAVAPVMALFGLPGDDYHGHAGWPFCTLRINFRRQSEAPCAAFGNSRYRRFAVDDYCKNYT